MKIPPEPRDELLLLVFNAIEELAIGATAGDDKAARGLFSLAGTINSKLAPLLRAPGPLLRAMLERVPSCPVNLPVNPKRRDALIAELGKLGLARNCEVNMTGKFNPDESPMSKAVATCNMLCLRPVRKNAKHRGLVMFDGKPGPFPGWIEWRDASASKIPQNLTRDNAREWADLAEPLLTIFWGRFEQHHDFAQYRKSKAWEGATPGKLRGELVRMWRQSWKGMANP